MMKKISLRVLSFIGSVLLLVSSVGVIPAKAADDVITIRVCNWEEYIDEGGWGEDEVIDLESGDIFGDAALYEEFEDWYYENYGQKVNVEYSCFGTNEELYNMLTLGDEFDLVCPSEYMIMKLLAEDRLVPFTEDFFDEDNELNYYYRNVSPFIREVFETNEINGEYWDGYAACYMWGVVGFLYNPEVLSEEDVSTWKLLVNEDYKCQITIKDNVRDSYFATLGAIKGDMFLSEEFLNDPDYHERLEKEMNDTSPETIAQALEFLQKVKENAYSFETDSGKADMVTGKVYSNLQWSGDAVYAMDQADEEDFELDFAVPEECTNLWFDGWVMLKDGIDGNADKQRACQAFVNFLSRPDNAVRNMYYIGYTSSIAGGTDGDQIFEYVDWCYSAEEDEEDTIEYDLGYFFDDTLYGEDAGEGTGEYVLTVPEEQTRRQLFAQYPPREVTDRSAIMRYFDGDANARINQMWINVRCYNIKKINAAGWAAIIVAVVLIIASTAWMRIKKSRNRSIRRPLRPQ